MAVNATGALDSRDSAGFAAAYSVMRFVLAGQYLRARRVRRARPLTTRYAAARGVAAALWLTSALLDAPERFVVWALALAIDVGTPLVTTRHPAPTVPAGGRRRAARPPLPSSEGLILAGAVAAILLSIGVIGFTRPPRRSA